MNGTVVRLLINKRPHFLTIYTSINSKVQHPPEQPPDVLNFWRLICSNFGPPRPKLGSNVLLKRRIWWSHFFVKGKIKSATVTFYILTKLWNLDLVNLLFRTVRWRKWTHYLETPPYFKIKHLHSARKTWHLQFQIPHTQAGMTVKYPWVAGKGGVGVEVSSWSVYYEVILPYNFFQRKKNLQGVSRRIVTKKGPRETKLFCSRDIIMRLLRWIIISWLTVTIGDWLWRFMSKWSIE